MKHTLTKSKKRAKIGIQLIEKERGSNNFIPNKEDKCLSCHKDISLSSKLGRQKKISELILHKLHKKVLK